MPKEIERKFLVKGNTWRQVDIGILYKQGYISTIKENTVRVRIIENKGYLTIKGKTEGATRLEYEYEIPVKDAEEILVRFCQKPLIEKKRYQIEFGGHKWEIDEFQAENKGLVLAEVEIENENEEVNLPGWIGKEVTGDVKYYNVNLVKHPYSKWKKHKD